MAHFHAVIFEEENVSSAVAHDEIYVILCDFIRKSYNVSFIVGDSCELSDIF